MDIVLSIITVNYNGLDDTCSMIDSIPQSLTVAAEVIVVDNGSQRNEAAIIAQRYPQVVALRSNENLGFAGGNNLGIEAARGKYLYFVNNDTEFLQESHIETLIDRLESSPDIGAVCPKIYFFWGERLIQFAGYTKLSPITLRNQSIGFGEQDHGQYDSPHPTPYAHGAAMMLKRSAIMETGAMPTCYFLYYEELDWSVRLRQCGYTIWYEPASNILHKESQSTGQGSPLRTYYVSRNRLLFARRNLHGLNRLLCYLYLALLVSTRDTIRHLSQGRYDLIKATYHGIAAFIKKK